MPDLKIMKNKHLTLDDRQEIHECLDKGMTFKAIAKRIRKDPTTVSKEVKKHLAIQPLSVTRTKIDGSSIEERGCPLLLKTPFVCNPCKKRRGNCAFQKQLYIAKNAQAEYELLLRQAREGIPLNKEDFWQADTIIAEGIKKGQRLYHIMESNAVGFFIFFAYRHLHRGYLSVSKLDFPRVVKFKTRKQYRTNAVPKAIKEGRTYNDFLAYIGEHGIKSWVEMDTVIGRIGVFERDVAAAGAQLVEIRVFGDGAQPGQLARLAAMARRRRHGLKKGLLRELLGQTAVARQRHGV
jgi:hypothetical protein